MSKSFILLTFTFFSIFSFSLSAFSNNDFLKTDGEYIKNNYGKGSNIYLRGTNIGNLFVQEAWMSATNSRDLKTTIDAFTSRFGQEKALELLDYYEGNYFTIEDIENLKKIGASVLRVPFTYFTFYKRSGNDWIFRDSGFNRLDWIVQECSKRGIYVILDMHGAFGSQNGQDHSGEVIDKAEDVTFYRNEDLMSRTLNLWKIIARHYKGNPAIAGYDTLNEPAEKAGQTTARHWEFYDRMYKIIRAEDPERILIFEACWGVQNLPHPKSFGWTNVVYSYHHYTWDYTDDSDRSFEGQKNAIENLVNNIRRANYGVPTFIGEFTCFGNNRGWDYVLDKMNTAGWHYTTWSYKTHGQGSWGIYQDKGREKVDPHTSSEDDIRRIWGKDSIGTNPQDTGITLNHLPRKLPGTVIFMEQPLSDKDFVGLKANINNKYVSADNYGMSNLVASRDEHKEWEDYKIIENSDGTVSFLARANSRYLCAVFDDPDTRVPVIARSNKIEAWEKFYRIKNDDGSFSFKTVEKNMFLQADIEHEIKGIIHARGENIGTWEKFSLNSYDSKKNIIKNEILE